MLHKDKQYCIEDLYTRNMNMQQRSIYEGLDKWFKALLNIFKMI